MVYVLLGEGFEEVEALTPVDLLRRAGVPVATVGVGARTVAGGHGIRVEADMTLEQMDLTQLDMIVLPGGMGGVTTVRNSPAALEALRFAHENGKFVAAICAGPTVLADLRITDGHRCTCYPGMENEMGDAIMVPGVAAVRDGHVITGTSAGSAEGFALELVTVMAGKEAAQKVTAAIHIRPWEG